MADAVLRTDGLDKYFGGIHAVDDVSIEVEEGEILSIIGPNGAGKTTLFNLVTGVHPPSSGRVEFRTDGDWRDITGWETHDVARTGLVRTFQNARPFGELTARENVLVGLGSARYRSASMFRTYRTADARERANELLERVGLADYANTVGSDLPLGLQRRLEIARVLALDPSVLLFDEPAAGLNDEESDELMDLFESLVADGLTVVLIEHAMDVVMGVSDRIYVLDQGEVIAEGDPASIQTDERVKSAYLGETAEPEGATDA